MWLLRTDTAELHYFVSPVDALCGYAILSHTWDGAEQTFQELRAVIKRSRNAGANPRDDPALSPKIHNFCVLAERNGFRWVWIDSCCIDKTSSSELSEAINSMYKWYAEAEVCYAYLADVPDGPDDLEQPDSAFRKSRWHTRGWTLQELISPDFFIFLSAEWSELGSRAALAGLLQEVTGVPFRLLIGKQKPANYSVGIRMYWAHRRKTTRVEDEAYCLMGLFGVSMPTNYGEGRKAFIRLQYEIMQHNPDMSLFAFGYWVPQNHNLNFYPGVHPNNRWMYLLADSPHQFYFEYAYIPNLRSNAKEQYPPPLCATATGPFDGVELPRMTVTTFGIKLRVPIYEADGITIAVILCTTSSQSHFGLFLTRDSNGRDPTRPRYLTTCLYTKTATGSMRYTARMVDLGDNFHNLTFNGKLVKASWRTIYVVPTAADSDTVTHGVPNLIVNCDPTSRFRIPRWLIARFATLQFEVTEDARNRKTLQVLRMSSNIVKRHVFVCIGSCTKHHNYNPETPPVLWANVHITHLTLETFWHDCSEDHLDSESWATRSRDFGDADYIVRLSFTPSTRMSEKGVLLIHLELFGRVFEELLREAAITLPSLADLEEHRPRLTPAPFTDSPSESEPIAHKFHSLVTNAILPESESNPSSGVAATSTRHSDGRPTAARTDL